MKISLQLLVLICIKCLNVQIVNNSDNQFFSNELPQVVGAQVYFP